MKNTRKGLEEALVAMGMSHETSQEVLDLTAPVRHRARVGKARLACQTGASKMIFASGDRPDAFESDVIGVALCAIEMFGLGGTRGLTGEGSIRIPQFRGLGKGRKQAYDGPAWSAAIQEAAYEIFAGLQRSPAWKCGDLLAFAPVLPEGGDPDPGWTGIGIALTPDGGEILPLRGDELRPWARVVAILAAADRAIDLLPFLPSAGTFAGMYSSEIRNRPNWPEIGGCKVSFVGAPDEWSLVLDALADALAALAAEDKE